MKESLAVKYPYGDQRGEWIIVIRKQGNRIIVSHTKKEISWAHPVLFKFTWTLRIELSEDASQFLDVTVTIDEFNFEDGVPQDIQKDIIATFNSPEFIEPFYL